MIDSPDPLGIVGAFSSSSAGTPIILVLSAGADPTAALLKLAKDRGYEERLHILSPGIRYGLTFLGLLGAVICYCRFGRRNKRALKRALQPKQLVELPQMVVGSGGDAGKPGNSTLAETLD